MRRISAAYVARVPTYKYDLPCGVVFKTHIRSQEDEDGIHWFPCRRCPTTHGLKFWEFVEYAPNFRGKMGMDEAIIFDRIARDLKISWGGENVGSIAKRHGKSRSTVLRIGRELGVWS